MTLAVSFANISRIAAIWLLAASGVCSASEPVRSPHPFLQVQTAELQNGLRILIHEKHTSPLVALDLWIAAGAREEKEDEDGCAHFLEHTLFKGTTTRAPGEIDFDLECLGGTLNAATGPDYAHFYTVVPKDKMRQALLILGDVVRNATLPESEIDRERGVILDELAQRNADPYTRMTEIFYITAFHIHPYRRSPGGTTSGIRARNRETLLGFYRRNYTPARCTLAIAGDIAPSEAVNAARLALGEWSAGDSPGNARDDEKVANGYRELESLHSQLVDRRSPDLNSYVGLGLPAPAARDATNACAALVTAAILGTEEEPGRLAANPGLGGEAEARYTPRRDASLFTLLASVSKGESGTMLLNAMDRVRAALLNSLNSLLTLPPTQPELDRARMRVLGHLHVDTETDVGAARAMGYANIVQGEMPTEEEMRINHVSTNDVLAFVTAFLDPRRVIVVQLKPQGANQGAPQ